MINTYTFIHKYMYLYMYVQQRWMMWADVSSFRSFRPRCGSGQRGPAATTRLSRRRWNTTARNRRCSVRSIRPGWAPGWRNPSSRTSLLSAAESELKLITDQFINYQNLRLNRRVNYATLERSKVKSVNALFVYISGVILRFSAFVYCKGFFLQFKQILCTENTEK